MRTQKTLVARRQWRPDIRVRRAGFTLIEAVISILLVGMTLVTAINLAGLSGKGQIGAFQQRRGWMLARELLIEIQAQSYVDPDLLEQYWDAIAQSGSITLSGGDSFGPAIAEVTGNRSLFDDVDDYHGWAASPPQDKDGAVQSDLTGWTRSVVVERMNLTGLGVHASLDMGLRRITVTTAYKGGVVATMIGFKSAGLPPLEACCECNEPCLDLPVTICESRGGEPQGFGTRCSVDACYLAKVAVVTKDPGSLTTLESDRIAMLESLDFSVTTIDGKATQGAFTALASTIDTFYVTDDVNIIDLGKKLESVTGGVLIELTDNFDVFGFAEDKDKTYDDQISITDGAHYITQPMGAGVLKIFDWNQDQPVLSGTLGGGVESLATSLPDSKMIALAVLESGASMYGGGTAAGRRVKLPWSNGINMSDLSASGETILERGVLWAAGCEAVAVCGDGECELGENACACAADCGTAPAIETILVNCNDGLDNDCDGNTDCDDVNCALDGACFLPSCGNLICEAGEDCHNCIDCPGVTIGLPLLQFCCGDGVASTKEVNLGLCNGNY